MWGEEVRGAGKMGGGGDREVGREECLGREGEMGGRLGASERGRRGEGIAWEREVIQLEHCSSESAASS